MKLLERIRLAGFRRFAIDGAFRTWRVREANGEVVVTMDEEGLRGMIHQAILSRGRKCKAGPLHVEFRGLISVRDARLDELDDLRGDDVFAGHVWASRPR